MLFMVLLLIYNIWYLWYCCYLLSHNKQYQKTTIDEYIHLQLKMYSHKISHLFECIHLELLLAMSCCFCTFFFFGFLIFFNKKYYYYYIKMELFVFTIATNDIFGKEWWKNRMITSDKTLQHRNNYCYAKKMYSIFNGNNEQIETKANKIIGIIVSKCLELHEPNIFIPYSLRGIVYKYCMVTIQIDTNDSFLDYLRQHFYETWEWHMEKTWDKWIMKNT